MDLFVMSTYLEKFAGATSKFLTCLNKLQIAQTSSESSLYPFVVNVRANELLVHLGNQANIQDQRIKNCQTVETQNNLESETSKQVSIKKIKKRRCPKLLNGQSAKNIPKNFSKAIISFCLKKKDLAEQILGENYEGFPQYLKQLKQSIKNTQLFAKAMQETQQEPILNLYNRAFRLMSQYFLKKRGVSYIFNSRISSTNSHLKFRRTLVHALLKSMV